MPDNKAGHTRQSIRIEELISPDEEGDKAPSASHPAANHKSGPLSIYPSAVVFHQPRAPRPPYTEEEKFFIMFARIKREQHWPDIEADFERIFRSDRSRGGLTSVYYRIRSDWKLRTVSDTGKQFFPEDVHQVDLRARHFSREFLAAIGYQ